MSFPRFTQDGHIDAGQPDRYLTEKEQWEVWKKVYGEGLLQPHEMHGYRVILAWRITRIIAHRVGLLHLDERLSKALPKRADWIEPTKALQSVNGGIPARLLEGGLALTPTQDREHQHRFAAVVQNIAEKSHMHLGTAKLPRLGYYGLVHMTHGDTIAEVWPDAQDILDFEERLIDQMVGFVVKWSKVKIRHHLRDLLGLSVKEVGGLIEIVRAMAREYAQEDLDTKRALLEMQIDDFRERAREAGDLNNEMKALKTQSIVSGVTRSEPEDRNAELIGIIQQVEERHRPQITLSEDPE